MHPKNTLVPKLVTLFGIVMEVRPENEKALSRIEVILLELANAIEVRVLQLLNAFAGTVVTSLATVTGLKVAGQQLRGPLEKLQRQAGMTVTLKK